MHWDYTGHTGEMVTMCRGTLLNVSKRKLHVGSSTELELISIADMLGIMMWRTYFMEN